MKKNYVIIRSQGAGVFFGNLISKEGNEVRMDECRKLWKWFGAAAVEQIALDGILPSEVRNCKFTVSVDNSIILNVIQILKCTEKAIESIKSVKEWKI